MTFLIIGAVVLGLTAYLVTHSVHKHKYNLTPKAYKALSWPSQQIWEVYQKIPSGFRPSGNVLEALKALDYKHGGKHAINRSCQDYYFENCSWDHFEYGSSYRDFRPLYDSLLKIRNELEEQSRALELNRRGDALSLVQSIIDEARDTAEIVRQVTREMT